jgi:6-phosphogluconolactonase
VTDQEEIIVAGDDAELASLGAELLARAIDDAARDHGRARVALSGGTTPGPALRALASLSLPWDRVEWFQVDERAVGPQDARSNWRGLVEALGAAGRGAAAMHRMEAERADRAAVAADYERIIRRSFGVASAVAFDAMVLGIGDDGHTASLFPGLGSVAIDDRLVAAVEAPGGLEPRLTLTAPVIREARLALVLARGASKKEPLRAARAAGPLDEVPARVVAGGRGRIVWVVDRAAAG